MRHICAYVMALSAVLAAAAPAEAKNSKYKSRHPFRGGFCSIDVPHVHAYAPTEPRAYRVVDGEYYFVGDPVAYGYDGPRYAYYGSHPVVEVGVSFGAPVYCYLNGPHYHWYTPPIEARFETRAGVYWYVGAFEPVYYEEQPRYVVINDVYRPMQYERPVAVVEDAPPGWRAVPPGQRRAVVAAPQPQVHVGVGIHFGSPPPVVVRERVYVAEPPQRVYVAEPPGQAKKHWGYGPGQGGGNWKGNGHHKGKWKD